MAGPPILEGWRVVAIPRHSTHRSVPCAPSRLHQPGLLESATLRNKPARPGLTVAAITLWVTVLMQGLKLALDLTRLGSRFLSSRLTAQFHCRITGSAATPSRGTGDICLPAACAAEGRAAPVAVRLSPVARDYPSRALGGCFMPPRCDCSIKERGKRWSPPPQSHAVVADNLFTNGALGKASGGSRRR